MTPFDLLMFLALYTSFIAGSFAVMKKDFDCTAMREEIHVEILEAKDDCRTVENDSGEIQ